MATFLLVCLVLNFIQVRKDINTLMGRVQCETLKYLYPLFSDDSVLRFDSKLPPIQSTASVMLIIPFSPMQAVAFNTEVCLGYNLQGHDEPFW